MHGHTRTYVSVFAMLLAVAVSGCRTGAVAFLVPQSEAPVWPAAPAAPRVKYVKSVRSSNDLGFKLGWVRSTINFITGSKKGREMLVKPFSVCLDRSGNLCVTDTGSISVHYFDFSIGRSWCKSRFGEVDLKLPVSVAKHGGVIYIADPVLGMVLAVDEKGDLLFQVTEGLIRPVGLAIWKDRLFIVDSKSHKLLQYDLKGEYVSESGGRGIGNGQFNYPTHVVVDSNGRIYVTDSMSHRVQVIAENGSFISTVGSAGDSSGHFNRPKGVAPDNRGNIYVVDAIFDNVQIFDADGTFLMTFGSAGTDEGEFWMPIDIEYTDDDFIYISDSYNSRIQIFKYVGEG